MPSISPPPPAGAGRRAGLGALAVAAGLALGAAAVPAALPAAVSTAVPAAVSTAVPATAAAPPSLRALPEAARPAALIGPMTVSPPATPALLATAAQARRSARSAASGESGEPGAAEQPGPSGPAPAHALPTVCPQRTVARYRWPTSAPARVLRGFDPPARRWLPGHRGIDLSAEAGSPVRAAGLGRVAWAGELAGRPVISVSHPDGIRTTYEPVAAVVSVGDVVAPGQVIGTLVAGHRADSVPALHWGARSGPDTYVNPLRLLCPAIIRLKPVV